MTRDDQICDIECAIDGVKDIKAMLNMILGILEKASENGPSTNEFFLIKEMVTAGIKNTADCLDGFITDYLKSVLEY